MTAVELLARLRDRGVILYRDGERLAYEAPPGALTPKARETLHRAKPALLTLLAREAAMEDQIAAAYRQIGEVVPGGAVPWAEQERPGLLLRVDTLARAWAAAYDAHDPVRLARALAAFGATLAAIGHSFQHATDPRERTRAILQGRQITLQQEGDRLAFRALETTDEHE